MSGLKPGPISEANAPNVLPIPLVLSDDGESSGGCGEEDSVGVGCGDVVRRGNAEAGAGDVWVSGGDDALVRGCACRSAGLDGVDCGDGGCGTGGDVDWDSGGDDCGARSWPGRPGFCGDRRGGGTVDCADRRAAGLATCAVGAGIVPAVRYLEAVADTAIGAPAGRDGNHAGRCGGGGVGAGGGVTRGSVDLGFGAVFGRSGKGVRACARMPTHRDGTAVNVAPEFCGRRTQICANAHSSRWDSGECGTRIDVGAPEFVAREPTSQNRDVGHPILWWGCCLRWGAGKARLRVI